MVPAGLPGQDPATDAAATGGPGTLALFLLLCGLFAVIAAQGRPDVARAVLAVGSVRAAFGEMQGWSLPAGAGEGGVRDEVDPLGHFAAVSKEDGPVVIELATRRLFAPDGRVPRARFFLFARLAAASRAGRTVRVLAPVAEAAERLPPVLDLLRAHGADSRRLAFGVDPALRGRWRFEVVEAPAG